jgi:hypothetical protein
MSLNRTPRGRWDVVCSHGVGFRTFQVYSGEDHTAPSCMSTANLARKLTRAICIEMHGRLRHMLPMVDESCLPEGDTTVTRTKDVALMVALDHRPPRASTGNKRRVYIYIYIYLSISST